MPRGEGMLLPGDDAREMRAALRRDAPLAPGVYGMIDEQGELIYVGQSKSLRARLLSYWSAAADDKAQRIVAHARRLVWETVPDALAAQLRELELIRRWRPRLNVRGQPGRLRATFVALGRGLAAQVYLTRNPGRGEGTLFGPVRATRTVRQAVRLLNDQFLLRDCGQKTPIHFADQGQLFAEPMTALCLRHALGTCLGPCARMCTSQEYARQVRAARRFLGGSARPVLDRLEKAMAAASAERHYEQAAVYRNLLDALEHLHDQLHRIRDAEKNYRFVYPLAAHDGGRSWYLIDRGHVLAALPEPQTPQAAAEFLSMIQTWEAGSRPPTEMPEEDVMVQWLVAGWFRSHPEELGRTLPIERAKRWLGRKRDLAPGASAARREVHQTS